MGLSIAEFKANFISGARPNLYTVTIGRLGEGMSFLCKATSLPASIMGNVDVPYMGRQLKVAGNRTYEDWTVTVLNDTDFAIRAAVEQWQNEINSHQGNLGPNTLSYFSDARVDQLDQTGAIIYTYDFIDIWPLNVAAIELAYDTNDTIEEFQITFSVGSYHLSSAIG